MKVTKVETQYDNVRAYFEDGHSMCFTPYAHGAGYGVEGMKMVQLWANETGSAVFHYYGRLYRCGPQSNEHKIAVLKDGYTQQRVAEYWSAAKDWLNQNYFEADPSPRDLWYPWKLICTEGWIDLGRLREGNAEFLSDDDDEQ